MQWFKLSKILFDIDEDIIFGAVYVPPESSKYMNQNLLDSFYAEIDNFISNYKYVILQGDFNARTSNMPDIVDADQRLFEYVNMDTRALFDTNLRELLRINNMNINRYSYDNSINRFGKMLIEFCRANDFVILNGRSFSDKIGRFTCNDTSVIDYVITSCNALSLFREFYISEYCPLLSDVHCCLNFTLSKEFVNYNQNEPSNEKIRKWDDSRKQDFIDNVNVDIIETALQILSSNVVFDQTKIDDVVHSFENALVNSARNTFGVKNVNIKRNMYKVKQNNKWFNTECKMTRVFFHRCKRRYSSVRNNDTKTSFLQASKNYKSVIRKSVMKHKREVRRKIRNMRSNSPKDYWNYINSLNDCVNTTDVDCGIFFDYFKNLNASIDDENLDIDANFPNVHLDHNLNTEISVEEIKKCINKLKSGKACGLDNVFNEYIKATSDLLMPFYHKLFNIVFETGLIPESWLIGSIVPIFKNKGDKNDPKNYRPITILSCVGKLFTAVLNNRLTEYLETYQLLNKNQAGFRKKHSTVDHIFVLHTLAEICKRRNKKLFCCFVDFQKAFDSVWRVGLWSKLVCYDINGNFFRIIKNMYSGIKSCISINNKSSNFFPCARGVRQGENLSPLLFSLFLNDLENYFTVNNGKNVTISDETLDMYLKLVVILYADDTVIFANSEEDLTSLLHTFNDYCSMWKLDINFDKTKIMVFGDRYRRNRNFIVNGNNIEVVDQFKYLGIFFSKNRKFASTKKHIVEQAKKGLFSLYRKIRNLDLSIDCQLKLFDSTILPILTYGCEVWGYSDLNLLEKVHTDFLKHILHVKRSTPHIMLYGDLGRFPIHIAIKKRMVGFWYSLVFNADKLSSILYKFMYADFSQNNNVYGWLSYVKSILDECGLSFVWNNQSFVGSKEMLLSKVEKCLQDQYAQTWHHDIFESNKCINYRMFKTEHKYEPYLDILSPFYVQRLINFRMCNNHLPVEKLRWADIARNDRICNICNLRDIGDEFHYLFKCTHFSQLRRRLIPETYLRGINCFNFNALMNTKEENTLYQLGKFLDHILKYFKQPPGRQIS